MKFDAYVASIMNQTPVDVAKCLAEQLDGIVARGKSLPRYGQVLNIDVGNRTAAWVGLEDHTGRIQVEGKGETSPALANAIRTTYTTHTCSRIDVCEDFDEPGAFERLQAVVRANKGPRVKAGYVALPDNVEDGRTWAAGVRGGNAYIRVYEAGKHPDRLHLNKPDWARIENECRPHYARDKVAAATMTPLEVWGFTAWTQAVGHAVTQVEIPRFEPAMRYSNFDQTTNYIAKTFRRHFEEMLGDGLDLSRTIQACWEEQDEFARKMNKGRGRGG